MLSLYFDIFGHFKSFLCPVDYNSLRFTCKDLNKLPFLDYYEIIKTKLSHCVDDPDKFLKQLQLHKAIISGDFILSCLYDNVRYKYIDIYEQCDKGSIRIYDNIPYFYEEYGDNIFHNYTNDKCEIYHQYLPMSPFTFIRCTSETDVDKVVFDGNKLYCKSWDKLISRSDAAKPGGYITFTTMVQDYRDDDCSRPGFNIVKHPKYNEILDYMSGLGRIVDDVFDKYRVPFSANLIAFVENGTLDLELYD